MKKMTMIQAALLTSIVVIGLGATDAQAATSAPTGTTTSGVWAVVTKNGAVPLAPGAIHMTPPPKNTPKAKQRTGGATPFLLDPGASFMCLTVGEEGLDIRDYDFYWNGGTQSISLLCGTSAYGYRHIMNEHEGDWEAVQRAAGDSGADYSWDDLMSNGIEASITYPTWITGPDSSNKFCGESSLAWFPNGDPNSTPTYVQRVETIWSNNNKTVITSFPITPTAPGC